MTKGGLCLLFLCTGNLVIFRATRDEIRLGVNSFNKGRRTVIGQVAVVGIWFASNGLRAGAQVRQSMQGG